MYMNDTNIFSTSPVKLSVISIEGGVWNINVAPDITVEKLKTMALCHFHSPLACIQMISSYKLVSVSEKRPLDNNNSILQEGLRNNDELLLVECQQPPYKKPFRACNVRGPTAEEIRVATMDVAERNPLKLSAPLESNLNSEIQKILVSLVLASVLVIAPSPNADEVFVAIQERLDAKAKTLSHPWAAHPFTDMGFSGHAAFGAVSLNRMNLIKALEWLFENGAEKEPQERAVDLRGEASSGASHLQCQQKAASYISTSSQREIKKSQSVATLLESFQAFRRRDFQPNMKALQNLMSMGFSEESSCDALCVTGNNQSAAREWLLGENRPCLEDLDTGLDPEGSLYKSIMSDPTVQLSLTSPKMLLAFLSMLENPRRADIWTDDPDVSRVLSQINKICQAEKHTLHMNCHADQQQLQSTRS